MLEFFSDITTLLARQAFQSGIISFDSHFPCLKQCVPKAPYHSPVRCRIVRRLDGELIRARGSPNHRGTGFIAYSSSAKRQKHVEKATSPRTNIYYDNSLFNKLLLIINFPYIFKFLD